MLWAGIMYYYNIGIYLQGINQKITRERPRSVVSEILPFLRRIFDAFFTRKKGLYLDTIWIYI